MGTWKCIETTSGKFRLDIRKGFALSRWLLSGLAAAGSVRSRELSTVIFMGPLLLETLCVLYLCAGITTTPRGRAGSDVQQQTDSICHVCDNSKGRKLRRLICVDSGPNPCAKTFLWREHTLFKTCMFWAVFALKRQSTMGDSLSWRLLSQGLLEGRSRTLSQCRRTDCAISQEFTVCTSLPQPFPLISAAPPGEIKHGQVRHTSQQEEASKCPHGLVLSILFLLLICFGCGKATGKD